MNLHHTAVCPQHEMLKDNFPFRNSRNQEENQELRDSGSSCDDPPTPGGAAVICSNNFMTLKRGWETVRLRKETSSRSRSRKLKLQMDDVRHKVLKTAVLILRKRMKTFDLKDFKQSITDHFCHYLAFGT